MGKDIQKILIDTDLGDDVDDAAAIIMALHAPELEVTGITTVFQNTEKRAEMVLDLCAKCGRTDIPVYVGQGIPLIERPAYEEEPIQYEILEQRYQINQKISATDFIIQSVQENPDLMIVEMGAMTNLALAFLKAPDVMRQAKIIAMGGIFSQSVPEWNIKCDPEAARIVMDYAGQLTMFGLEVTKHCRLSEDELNKLEENGSAEIDAFIKGVRIFQQKTGYPVTLHDVVLITYLLKPEIAVLTKRDYTVELAGSLTRGGIVLKGNMYHLDTAVDKEFYYAEQIDLEGFRQLVMDRIS